jgi:ribosomal protein S18 acetylase RimI-like enzyme
MTTIRALDAEDAAQYRAFRLEMLREWPSAFTSSYDEEVCKPVRVIVDRLTSPRNVMLGAFDGETLVGIAGLVKEERQQVRHKATLVGMAVASAAGGRGIGKALVASIIDTAIAAGLRQVGLTVSEGNEAAVGLYRSCGFVEWGRARCGDRARTAGGQAAHDSQALRDRPGFLPSGATWGGT